MECITGRRLSDHVEERMSIVEHSCPQGDTPLHLFFEYFRLHPHPVTCNLHVNAGWRPVITEYPWKPDHTLVADCAYLRRVAIPHGIHQRGDACLDESNKHDRVICFVERILI